MSACNYLLYNLSVRSELEIPALNSERDTDVTVQLTSPIPLPAEARSVPFYYQVSKKRALFHYRNIATYVINDGCEILVAPEPQSSTETVSLGLLNAPFALLFLQRGFLVLHSSALEINKKTIAFLGPSRAGKSSAALTLVASGHKLVSDDILPISVSATACVPTPAYPWMKISKEIALAAGLPFDDRPSFSNTYKKRIHHLSANQFQAEPSPLVCLYLLNWGKEFSIARIPPVQAILDLVAQSYGFVPQTEHQEEEKKRFLQSSQFIKTVPVFRLTRPKDLNLAMQLPSFIEDHLATI